MKTAWALPGQRDIDRNLNETGVNDLSIVRSWIEEHDFQPGTIYCSPSARTKQTMEGILPAFKTAPRTEICNELYSGFTEEYLDCIRQNERAETLMLIGHNPTCASLANILIGTGESQSLNTIAYKYPTGALAIMDFDIDEWSKIAPGTGDLATFLMPKPFRKY